MARKRRIRRKILLLSIAGAATRYAYGRRRRPEPSAPSGNRPDWAPLTPATRPVADAMPEPETAAADAAWVAPVDGACPLSHPVKGNANSGIHHVPGGRFYEATVPERCYRDPAAAEADGMRASKR